MHGLMLFYATHPFWVWLAVGAVFLAVEVATGTGWLLWPAASALLVGLLTLAVQPGLPVELGLFAVLTIATTYLARRFLRPVLDAGNPDLNDPSLRLVGRDGEALDGFANGKGRVFVDGKEWAAVAPEGVAPAAGQKVQVVAVEGAVLTVR
ncbi:NfeD family protein [Caulobacter sp. UNC358MFTsu5.1]|uniref:NfeD family protein n=1 Tax=Caulobacter sp. UNC358MFTsu5.1 TaxID=1449049 RepID=UPI0004A710C0|nr:NfeD family protein [Caulobacter sp. UNC358MFTsu5.1]